MVASCALPTAYRDEISINGTRYLDGGVADAIPAIQAYKMGAKDITVILSQSLGFTKPEVKSVWLMQKMYGNQPALLDKMLQRAAIYNETLAFLNNPPDDCTIRVIAPDEAFCVKRLTMDKKKLLNIAMRIQWKDSAKAHSYQTNFFFLYKACMQIATKGL